MRPLLFVSFLAGCLGSFDPTGNPGQPQPPPPGNPPPGPGPGVVTDGGTGPTFDLSGPPAVTGTLSVSLPSAGTNPQRIRLNEARDLAVQITPGNGFSGMVMFSVSGAPTGITATLMPPGAMMGDQPMQATLTIRVASDFTPQSNMPIMIQATSGTIVGQTQVMVNVPAELLVTISRGVNLGSNSSPNPTAFGAASMPVLFIAPGTKVTFVNEDSINHEIHSDGSLGIQHEGGQLQANGANSYTQTFQTTGTFDFRCHIHSGMRGQIVVQ